MRFILLNKLYKVYDLFNNYAIFFNIFFDN